MSVTRQKSADGLTPDAQGLLTITVSLPTDAVSLAREVWDYTDGSEKLDKSGISLERAETK
ncbi:MAG: hypothetical protein II916_06185 [Oscillospiraceae bacterium]|nr:hypothetical protein [Oscillospiraceae bacterium]